MHQHSSKIKMKAILIISLLLPAVISAQNSCNSYWTYGRDQKNQVEGFLTIPHTVGYTEHHIQIQLSMGAKLPSVSMNTHYQIYNFLKINSKKEK